MTTTEAQPSHRPRIESVDLVRGIIMIIMALDHTRDYFGIPGNNPTNLETTTTVLFFTRWITHFCAPVFFLLTGTGAFLSLTRKSPGELSRFLLTRGLWLIFFEAVVMRIFAYQFNADYRVTLMIVLWALAWAMITLSLLVRFPAWVSGVFGLVLIAGHNLFDGATFTGPLWTILHVPGFVINQPNFAVFIAYPLIPWVGVSAAGFALGQIFRWDRERRRRFLLRLGVTMIVGFIALRAINGYGDPAPWSSQPSTLFTLLSFLNTSKYPPSLIYLLMTLGPALLLLRALDGVTPAWLRLPHAIGKVPLFYFMMHFMLIHLIAVTFCQMRYGSAHWMFESPDLPNYPFTPPPGWGYGLPVVYGVWLSVVVIMYPLCRWYGRVKATNRSKWLSYL